MLTASLVDSVGQKAVTRDSLGRKGGHIVTIVNARPNTCAHFGPDADARPSDSKVNFVPEADLY